MHFHALTGRDRARQVDSEREALAREPPTSPGVRVQPDGMCYIIFTSGSTGRPKGAVLQHAGVVNYLHCITTCAARLLAAPVSLLGVPGTGADARRACPQEDGVGAARRVPAEGARQLRRVGAGAV